MDNITQHYLSTVRKVWGNYRSMAEKAMNQLSDEQFFQQLDPESNSVALIVKHMAGNLRSRWENFLTEDGEKPNRHRDNEFLVQQDTRDSLMQAWNQGWDFALQALDQVPALDHVIQIRGQDHTLLEAIERSVTHAASHIGQVVFLAKHFKGSKWQTLSIPRGQSETYNPNLNEKRS